MAMIVAAASMIRLGSLLAVHDAPVSLEAPPAAFETRPAPADGQTLTSNPPAFLWIPAAPAREYRLEYSREAAFPPDETTSVQTPWLIHVPSHPLVPGRWYWRWRPIGPQGEVAETSPVRSFTVPEGAIQVPFPDVAEAVRRLGTRRPRVLVNAEELPRVRAWAAQNQKEFLQRVRQDAERALTDELLPEPEFLPPPGDPNWAPLYTRIFRTTRPVYARMVRLAEGYLLSGDEAMGQAAKRFLMNFVSWNPEGSTSLNHNDEPATEFVRVCPRVYDWIYPLLTEEERQRCRAVFATRMQQIYSRWSQRPFERFPYESHNMGYYLPDLTEACIAMAGELEVEEMLRYCLLQLWSPYYPPYGGEDGGWQEGPAYWQWTMAVVARLYRLVERATGVPIASRSSLRNAATFKLYANPPYAQMSPFGDGQEGAAGGGETMYRLAALYRDPYALWYARQQNFQPAGLEAFLWDVSTLLPRPPIDRPQSHCFFSVGEACLHTALWDPQENVQFLFRSCPFGGISHAFADQNTFALDAYGEPLIIASGYYPYYGSPHHVQWTRTTAASNSILVNGQGQPKTWNWEAKGEIARFARSAQADFLVGDATRAYPGLLQRYLRRVLFVRPLQTGGPTLIALQDDLLAEKPSTFQWLLHASHRMALEPEGGQVWIKRGEAACRVDFLLPEKLRFSQTDQFPVPPENGGANQWHFTASTEDPTLQCQSLLLLTPHRRGEKASLPNARLLSGEGCLAVALAGEGAEHLLLFRTGDGPATVPEWGLRADAEAVALTRRQGRITGFFAAGGTHLEAAGQVLLDSGRTLDAGIVVFAGDAVLSAAAAEPTLCRIACPRRPAVVKRLDGTAADFSYDGQAGLLEILLPAGERHLSINFGAAPAEGEGEPPSLHLEGQPPIPMAVEEFPLVRRVRYTGRYEGSGGHHEITVKARNPGFRPAFLTVSVGNSETAWRLAEGTGWQEWTTPPLALPGDGEVAVMVDGSLGGVGEIVSLEARRVYGRNLVPNPGFEEIGPEGTVPGWTPTTITNGAQCAIESAGPGRTGERCLKVTCTQAGGDFGVYLRWPGVPPVDFDRRFRLSVWVRNGSDSQAGVQVTNSTWVFHQTTQRLRNCGDWTETASTFTLPAGENLTHLRLHLWAEREGVVLYADDVSLIELPLYGGT